MMIQEKTGDVKKNRHATNEKYELDLAFSKHFVLATWIGTRRKKPFSPKSLFISRSKDMKMNVNHISFS